MRIAILCFFAATAAVAADIPVARIADDARAVDRLAAMSKRDLPRDLLRRMMEEDVELLRGRRADGSYEHASYERLESGRLSDSFSVEENNPDKTAKLEVRGAFVYKLTIELPSRRLLVTKNKRLYVDRAEIEFIPVAGGVSRTQTIKIDAFIEPGTSRGFDLDEIAKQATARVYARSEKESGYSNVVLSLSKAKISDNPDSPYADAVASAKAIVRGLDHEDVPSIRAMAQRMANDLAPRLAEATAAAAAAAAAPRVMEVVAPRQDTETLNELQAIEDLLTGNDAERRQGLDRLHQLVRKLRTPLR